MEKDEILQGLRDAVLSLDKDKGELLAGEIVRSGIDPLEAIEKWMAPALEEIGRKFQSGDLYLPELQLSSDVFQSVMDLLQPELSAADKKVKIKGRVLIGTVKGDIHSIGKDLVSVIIKTSGFEVIDIGVDIPTFTFIEEAQKNKVDLIALSALLTTSMPRQREVIEALKSQGLREKFGVIVGGGPVSQEWADEISADGYGETAIDAVKVAEKLCGAKAF